MDHFGNMDLSNARSLEAAGIGPTADAATASTSAAAPAPASP